MATAIAQGGIPALLGQLQSGSYFTDLRIILSEFGADTFEDSLDHSLLIVGIPAANGNLLHFCHAQAQPLGLPPLVDCVAAMLPHSVHHGHILKADTRICPMDPSQMDIVLIIEVEGGAGLRPLAVWVNFWPASNHLTQCH